MSPFENTDVPMIETSALNQGGYENMQALHQEQRKQFYSVKASQYAQMLKTLAPKNNLPRASHNINRDMKGY